MSSVVKNLAMKLMTDEVLVNLHSIFIKVSSESLVSERCEGKGTSQHIFEAEYYP